MFTVTNDLTYDQRMDRICTSLSANGYNVTLMGFLKKRSIKVQNKTFRQIRLPVFFKKGKLFFIEYNFRLFWFLIFRRFDIYCGIDLDTLFPVYLNAKLKRKPIVYDAHEYYTELPEIIDRPVVKKFWLMLEKMLLPRIKYNYTVGFSIAEALKQKYHQPYEVIRNVPFLDADLPSVSPDEFILYQGALNKGRGLESLILAIADVPARLYIAGEGDLSKELRAFAASQPHAAKIRFLGYVRPGELKQYTRRAKIGVNFIENSGLSYYYSLSNKFFDYIHAGVPQVTMNYPEYQKLNSECNVALLIDDLQPATISKNLNLLLNDPAVYNTLKTNTYKAKQNNNWQNEEIKLLTFYSKIE